MLGYWLDWPVCCNILASPYIISYCLIPSPKASTSYMHKCIPATLKCNAELLSIYTDNLKSNPHMKSEWLKKVSI